MINLLSETHKKIDFYGLDDTDIIYIGTDDSQFCCSWDEFCGMADIEYDNDLGGQEILDDLIILFDDGGRFIRWGYLGSEGWRYIKPIVFDQPINPLTRLLNQCVV